MRFRVSRGFALAGIAAAALMAAPAFAQEEGSDLDALIEGSGTPDQALALARKQAAENDLTGAATTLERALLTHSRNNTRVRLFYATILCRLGDRQTAQTEIARSGAVSTDSPAWAETRAACGDVSLPAGHRVAGISGEAYVGVTYDSDLAGSLLVQFNLPTIPAVLPDDGFSGVTGGRISFRAPTGNAFLYGSAGTATRNGFDNKRSDYQVVDGLFGIGANSGAAEFSLGGIVRHARIAGSPFITELGGEAMVAFARGADSRIAIRGEVVQQDYMGSTAAFSRDGMRYDLGVSYEGRSNSTRFWFGIAYEGKDAVTSRTGYSGGRIAGGFRDTLDRRGTYLTHGISLRYVEYGDETGFPPANETRFNTRAALGIPIGTQGFAVEAGGSYSWRAYNRSSTLRNYTNVGGELRLVWNFGN